MPSLEVSEDVLTVRNLQRRPFSSMPQSTKVLTKHLTSNTCLLPFRFWWQLIWNISDWKLTWTQTNWDCNIWFQFIYVECVENPADECHPEGKSRVSHHLKLGHRPPSWKRRMCTQSKKKIVACHQSNADLHFPTGLLNVLGPWLVEILRENQSCVPKPALASHIHTRVLCKQKIKKKKMQKEPKE